MSVTTINRSTTLQGTARPGSTLPAGTFRTLRRAAQRRRYLAAQRAHERQDGTDAYVDRHGEPDTDVRTLTAFQLR